MKLNHLLQIVGFIVVLTSCQTQPETKFCDNFIKLISAPDSLPVYKFPFHLSDSEKVHDMKANGFDLKSECFTWVAYPLKSGLKIRLGIDHTPQCGIFPIGIRKRPNHTLLLNRANKVLIDLTACKLSELSASLDTLVCDTFHTKDGYDLKIGSDCKKERVDELVEILINHTCNHYEKLSKERFNTRLCELNQMQLDNISKIWKPNFYFDYPHPWPTIPIELAPNDPVKDSSNI